MFVNPPPWTESHINIVNSTLKSVYCTRQVCFPVHCSEKASLQLKAAQCHDFFIWEPCSNTRHLSFPWQQAVICPSIHSSSLLTALLHPSQPSILPHCAIGVQPKDRRKSGVIFPRALKQMEREPDLCTSHFCFAQGCPTPIFCPLQEIPVTLFPLSPTLSPV